MAEIKIEKKRPVWPWIILIVVLVAVALFFILRTDTEQSSQVEDEDMENFEEMSSGNNNSETTMQWEDEEDSLSSQYNRAGRKTTPEETRLGSDAVYTSTAFMELINSLRTKAAEQKIPLQAEFQQLQQQAEKINSGYEATSARELANKIADIIQNIQQQKYPQLEKQVQEVKSAAGDIGSADTFEENENLHEFFSKAKAALQQMN